MAFEIRHTDGQREDFGPYRYGIYEDGRLVARYWHDYRGDDHGIEFPDGTSDFWPVGRMTEFVTGGGPQPLGLSDQAIAYLEARLGRPRAARTSNPHAT